MARKRLTLAEEMAKYRKEWGLNPPPRSAVLRLHRQGLSVPQIADELGTSSSFVEGVLRGANPRRVVVAARPAFRFAHEEVTNWSRLKKAHPEATIRTVSVGGHRLRIAYWD